MPSDPHPRLAKCIALPNQGWLLGAVLALTASAYLGTLRFGFVYDDEGQILGNSYIQFWRHVPKYFISQVWSNIFPRLAGNFYRPLFLLWLRFNDAWFGFNPRGWHATVLALHLIATVLVYLIFLKVTEKPALAAIGALVFGLHPIHGEVVGWISGSTESLGAIFFLTAFLAYLKSREGNAAIWMTLSCFLFAVALFSKETEIVLPVIVLGHAWIYGSPSGKAAEGAVRRLFKSVRETLPYAPICLFYLFARFLVLHGLGHASIRLGWRNVLFTIPSMVAFYVKKWLLPIQLTEFYDMPYWSGWNFWHVFLPALSVLALAGVVWLARRQLGPREVAFAALWTIIPLLPILDASVFPPHDIVHDRYLYLPSVGASLLVALAVDWISRASAVPGKRGVLPVYVAAFLVLGGTLAVLTSHEVSFWVDDITMFDRAHTLAPLNPIARNDYGVDLAVLGKDDAARAVFQEALRADPTDWAAYFNLGRIDYREKKYADAEPWLRKASALNHTAPDVYVTLGLVELRTNRIAESLASMHQAVMLRPNDPTYLFAYGVVLAQTGDCNAARAQFQAALDIRPDLSMTQLAMSHCVQAAAQK
ncbi:MAG: tetratricopeptide repeat protein [Candidatus Acidiferrales bacterium]